MRTGLDLAKERGVLSDPVDGLRGWDPIPAAAFAAAGLSAVVACIDCGTTMALLSPSCLVDDNGAILCSSCAEGVENGIPVRARILLRLRMNLPIYEVTPEEEFDILENVLIMAETDSSLSEEVRLRIADFRTRLDLDNEATAAECERAASICWDFLLEEQI